MIEELFKYNFHGPFQISQNKAYIKHHYVPMDIGSLELKEVIRSKSKALTDELDKWTNLEKENERVLAKKK